MAITFDSSPLGPEGSRRPEDNTPVEDAASVELRLLPSHRSTVDDETIRLSVRVVDTSGIVDQLVTWKEAERRGPGGRPETFPTRALLVGLMACALSEQPRHLSRVTEILFRQLSPAWRGRLGLPEPPNPDDRQAWKALYRNVRTRFHAMLALVDPSPTPKNRRLDDDTFHRLTEQRRAELSEEEWAERYRRFEWLINALIEASVALLPRDVRRAFRGSVGIDGTLVRAHARPYVRKRGAKPKKGTKPEIVLHSVDPDAGYYVRQADERDAGVEATTGRDKIAWGYEATFAVSGAATPEEDDLFPNLILGMTVLDQPGRSPGGHGAQVLAGLAARGYPPGFLAADRAFSSAKPDEFQLRALALGYRPIYDYKKDQLGVQAEADGFLQIEGAWYCPAIPEALREATRDHDNGVIDDATYRQRLVERWKYAAKPKERSDVEGHVRLQCPAAGSWPMARCDLKPASMTRDTLGRLHIPVAADLAAAPPKSCTQQSVTVPPSAGAKFHQELMFKSAEWEFAYNSLRNTNEGMNGYIKDSAHEALDDPGRRRIHGVAAQSLFVALHVVAANVRKIRTYVATKALGHSKKPNRPRRRLTAPITQWLPSMATASGSSDPDPPLIA
jgi:hypothetical protein